MKENILTLLLTASLVRADITGQEPAAGSCICLASTAVNVRDGPCGSVILGQASSPQCFLANGVSSVCSLGATSYDFFSVQYGTQDGWMAGDYLTIGSAAQCAGSATEGNCANVEIVTRAEWGARPPDGAIPALPSKPVTMGFAHHTVTAHCYNKDDCMAQMRYIQSIHMDGNGWSDIGYNFLVGEDGRAYEGRGWDKVGAHTLGYNDVAVAVSCIGDYTAVAPNQAAQNAIRDAFDCAVKQNILAHNYEMFGHRDGGCTACPGDTLYPLIQTWAHYSFRDIPNNCRGDASDD